MKSKAIIYLSFLIGAILHIFVIPLKERGLLHYDDMVFIYPLKEMSLKDYFTQWLPDGRHFAFPLRDLSFYTDFFLEKTIGVPTYWITNYLLLFLLSYSAYLFFKIFFNTYSKWPLLLFLIFFFHPIQVELVQWAYNRKHLMSAIFTLWATNYFYYHYLHNTLSHKKIIYSFLLHLLSYLCIPTAIFWPLFPYLVLEKRIKNFYKSLIPLTIFECFVFVFQSMFYSQSFIHSKEVLNLDFWINGLTYFMTSIGRSTFNLVIPIQNVTYFLSDHPYNIIGLFIFFLFLLLLYRYSTKEILILFFMGFILIAPSFIQIPFYNYYVWSNRYLATGFPYLVIGGVLTFRNIPYLINLIKPIRLYIALILLLFYLYQDYRHIKPWKNEVTLMDFCADTEGTATCHIWSIKKAYDRWSFSESYPRILKAKKKYDLIASQDGSYEFEFDLPFMEAFFTINLINIKPENKWQEILQLEKFYHNAIPFCFTKVILLLQMGQKEKAYQQLQIVTGPYFYGPSLTINSLRGQFDYFCEHVVLESEKSRCQKLNKIFLDRVKSIDFDPKIYNFGKLNTKKALQLNQEEIKNN